MNFSTQVTIPAYHWKTGYKSKNLFMGSCFTENIGNKMTGLCYDADINPFGILYNPVSVANGIELLLDEKQFEKEDLVHHNILWHSFYHHGKFSSTSEETCLQQINSRLTAASKYLRETNFLFITFGTAWVYNYKKTGITVANCHKIPDNEFDRKKLTVTEIVERYSRLLETLREANPEVKIVFTVSPIRHWKDGPVENQRSKSVLILAVDEIIHRFGNTVCDYFPSYEIVMDELRDYRFYGPDMLHLSEQAVNYIWEKFEENLIGPESRDIAKKVQKIVAAVNHKPFNKFTKEHYSFIYQTLEKTKQLEQKHGFLNLEKIKQLLHKEMEKTGINISGT